MADFQIRCIKKATRHNPHDRIVSVGGLNRGRRWSLTQQDAVHIIEKLGHRFWVGARDNGVWMVVVMHHGNKYIKTENDEARPDNLLSLPGCPCVDFRAHGHVVMKTLAPRVTTL